MVVKQKAPESTKAVEQERVLTHDGQLQFERYRQWLSKLCTQSGEFEEFFNEEFDEILGSKAAFNKTWFLDLLHGRGWNRLKVEIDKFVEAQSKAVRNDVRDYYGSLHREAERLWRTSIGYTFEGRREIQEGFYFPQSLISPEGLPLALDSVEIDHEKLDSVRQLFNEYLDSPEGLDIYKHFVTIRDAYNALEALAKRQKLAFAPFGMLGNMQTFLERGPDGAFKIRSFRAHQLTHKHE